jgi:hypothetical protein
MNASPKIGDLVQIMTKDHYGKLARLMSKAGDMWFAVTCEKRIRVNLTNTQFRPVHIDANGN